MATILSEVNRTIDFLSAQSFTNQCKSKGLDKQVVQAIVYLPYHAKIVGTILFSALHSIQPTSRCTWTITCNCVMLTTYYYKEEIQERSPFFLDKKTIDRIKKGVKKISERTKDLYLKRQDLIDLAFLKQEHLPHKGYHFKNGRSNMAGIMRAMMALDPKWSGLNIALIKDGYPKWYVLAFDLKELDDFLLHVIDELQAQPTLVQRCVQEVAKIYSLAELQTLLPDELYQLASKQKNKGNIDFISS